MATLSGTWTMADKTWRWEVLDASGVSRTIRLDLPDGTDPAGARAIAQAAGYLVQGAGIPAATDSCGVSTVQFSIYSS